MKEELLRKAAANYGTPSYLFNIDEFSNRLSHIKKLLGSRIRICYAIKANPFLTKAAYLAADSLEVCSPGEFSICRRLGVKPEKIVLSGVNKEASEIEAVMEIQGAAVYTAESLHQLDLLETSAKKIGISHVPVLLRLTSGNQFGMDKDTIVTILAELHKYPSLDVKGLQYYSGTQKKKPEKICEELHHLDQLCTYFEKELGFIVRELEYGPGFPITYFEGETAFDEDAYLREFQKVLDSLEFSGIITLELGRFLAAPCGSYLTQIIDTKQNSGQNYCIIDGGIHHINYYGQTMAMRIPFYRFFPKQQIEHLNNPSSKLWTVCGSLCTSSDVIVKNLPLGDAKNEDLLVFENMGAYSVTEGIYLFLSRKLPRILFYSKEDGFCLIRDAFPTDHLNS